MSSTPQDVEKKNAGEYAAALARDGMTVGLGTGSTSAFAIRALARRVQEEGLRIRGVATSLRSEELARAGGIPLLPLTHPGQIDLYIDGADQVDGAGRLVKGGGGALLREKLVALNSRHRVIIVDAAKRVPALGGAFPLPVEVVEFGHRAVLERLAALPGCEPTLRRSGEMLYRTDGGNLIADCRFPGGIIDPAALADHLDRLSGVVEHGLFLGLCDVLVEGTPEGVTLHRFSSSPAEG